MNLNVKDQNESHAKNYLSMIASKGLCNVIQSDTRTDLARNTSTLIDHILVRVIGKKIESAVIELNISDHYAIYCRLVTQINTDRRPKTMQQYINSRKVAQGMTNTNWDEFEQYNCVNELYEQFRKRYIDIIEAATTTREEKRKKHWV